MLEMVTPEKDTIYINPHAVTYIEPFNRGANAAGKVKYYTKIHFGHLESVVVSAEAKDVAVLIGDRLTSIGA